MNNDDNEEDTINPSPTAIIFLLLAALTTILSPFIFNMIFNSFVFGVFIN